MMEVLTFSLPLEAVIYVVIYEVRYYTRAKRQREKVLCY